MEACTEVPDAPTLPVAAVSSSAPAAVAATPVVRTPKAPASRPATKNRPSPLLNLEVRSPAASPATPASAEKSPKEAKEAKETKRRPPPLGTVVAPKVSPCVDTELVSQCGGGGAKSRTAQARGLSPRVASDGNSSEGLALVAQALTPQPGSEGASTTASSTSEWCELQGAEELEFVRRLGQGSSGVVEKHRHTRTRKELAIKIIHASSLDEAQRKAILLELRTFNRCRNPHIVDFYGAFFHENNIHIGLEYMDAGALSSVLEIRGTVPETLMANITWQVLDGLEYLHCEMHVIHRDIKPSNLLLSSSGIVKVTDFGVSGEIEDGMRESAGKVTWVGTIYYMSPERAQGHPYRYDSDLWSLGLTLIECLCGRFPYLNTEAVMKQLSFWELMRRIVEQEPPNLPAGAEYSVEAKDFIQQVLQKDSRKRPGSAMMKTHAWLSSAATQAELAAWIEQSGVVGESQAAPSPSPSPSTSACSGKPPRAASSSSTSPVKSISSSPPTSSGTAVCRPSLRPGSALSDLDFVSVSPARQMERQDLNHNACAETVAAEAESQPTPSSLGTSLTRADSNSMDKSVRGGANPFMSRFPSTDMAGTPKSAGRGGDDPFAQYATGLEASSDRPSSASRSVRHAAENPFLLRGASAGSVGAETPMGQSMRGGENPFAVRGGATSPGLESLSPPSACSGGISADTPMAQSLRGGDNPFLQRAASAETPMGYP